MSLRLPNLFAVAFLLCLAALIPLAVANSRMDAALQNPPVIPIDSHSTAHLEANDVVKCDNILSIFMDNKCEKHNIIKQMEDGQIGCEVVQMSKRGVLLKTAYIMVGVDEQELNRIMSAKGCIKIYP